MDRGPREPCAWELRPPERPHPADADLASPRRGNHAAFGGSTEALRSISIPVLYMPWETDFYFPLGDARQESKWIRKVTLAPIPSLWGHTAGVGASPEDLAFIERKLRMFRGTPPSWRVRVPRVVRNVARIPPWRSCSRSLPQSRSPCTLTR
jgi:hypothetical protein